MPDTPILTNPLKEMMKAGKVALGMNVRLARSGDIARIAKTCGHDFIFIDGQHAIFTRETIAHIAHTALGCGITPWPACGASTTRTSRCCWTTA